MLYKNLLGLLGSIAQGVAVLRHELSIKTPFGVNEVLDHRKHALVGTL